MQLIKLFAKTIFIKFIQENSTRGMPQKIISRQKHVRTCQCSNMMHHSVESPFSSDAHSQGIAHFKGFSLQTNQSEERGKIQNNQSELSLH
jgi:hypothetical protein